jgi:hypothetical protein
LVGKSREPAKKFGIKKSMQKFKTELLLKRLKLLTMLGWEKKMIYEVEQQAESQKMIIPIISSMFRKLSKRREKEIN